MLIGYARVSTDDQVMALQLDALRGAGCERVHEETASGTRADRPVLARVLEDLRAGDTLVVWKLDRLGRSAHSLIGWANDLAARGVNFRSLTETIDTSTIAGTVFFQIMASLAQMERSLTRERTMAGLTAARSRGRCGGRRPKLTPHQIEQARRLMADQTESAVHVATTFGINRSTLYRLLKRG